MQLIIFDLDDTLFRTAAKILVFNGSKLVKRLSSSEYQSYELANGEHFDYREFKDSSLFYKTSIPISETIETLRNFLNYKVEDSKVIIITARPDLDDKETFLDTFRKFDIAIDKVFIERAGNHRRKTSAENKLIVFEKYVATKKYSEVIIFDDLFENLEAFLSLKIKYPDIVFKAFLVSSTSNATQVNRVE